MTGDRREFLFLVATIACGCSGSTREQAAVGTQNANETGFVIAEPCVGVKDTACVDVCPVDCIHPRKDELDHRQAAQLYINPEECIECGACVPACPVGATFAANQLPSKWVHFADRNRNYYRKK